METQKCIVEAQVQGVLKKTAMQEDNVVDDNHEKVQLSGSEGSNVYGTQESDPDNFAKQVGVVISESQEIESQFDDSGGRRLSHPRRSSRLKDSEAVNVIDKAKERAKIKDLEKGKGIKPFFPTVINSTNNSSFQFAYSLGFDLGCSLDMVEHNLKLLSSQEQAKVNLLLECKKNERQSQNEANIGQGDPDPIVLHE